MDIYRFVPTGRFTRKFRPQHRKQLLDLLHWYDLVSGVVTLGIVSLVIVPLVYHATVLYALWPLGFASYVIANVASGPMVTWNPSERPSKTWLGALQLRFAGLRDQMRKWREQERVNYLIAFLLILGALAFSASVRRADEGLGLSVEYDGALWLLFVLPPLRLTRYASIGWLAFMTGISCGAIFLTHLLADDPFTKTSMRLILIQSAWIFLICLLPGVLASYLTETRFGLETSSVVVKKIMNLPFESEEDFLNRAAEVIKDRMGYAEVNILLPTTDAAGNYKALRLVGAATRQARLLFKDHPLAIDVSQGKGVTVQALLHGEARVVNDVDRDAREQQICWGRDLLENTRSEMALPILFGEKLLGVLDIHSNVTCAFSEDDEAIMQAIVSYLAVALDDHYNLEQIKGLHEASQSIAHYFFSQNAVQPMLQAIALAALQTLAASNVILYAWDPVRRAFLEPVIAGNPRVAPASAAQIADPGCDSIVRRIMKRAGTQTRVPAMGSEQYIGAGDADDVWMLDKLERGRFVERAQIQTSIAFPLQTGSAPGNQEPGLGAVFINYDQPRPITESHRKWCRTLGNLASLALQNAWLREKIIDEERWDLWAEIHDGMVQDAWIMRDAVNGVAAVCQRAEPLAEDEQSDLDRAVWCSASLHREVNYLDALWKQQRQRGTALGAYAADGSEGDVSFFDALSQYALVVEQSMQVTCTFNPDGDDAAIQADARHAIWMIVREAVRNAWRHGRASQIRISMCVSGQDVTLTIVDNGKGFQPERVRTPRGIKNFKKRAKSCGGDADVNSILGVGTQVHVTIPLRSGEASMSHSASVEREPFEIPTISVFGGLD